MANKFRGQVELRIEEEDESVTVYTLHYDGNALVEIEEAMGMTINTLITDRTDMMDGMKFRRVALYEGLRRDPRGRKLTLKQCGELVASSQGREIAHCVLRGIFLALGADIDKAKEEAEAAEQAAATKDSKKGDDDPLEQEAP